MEDAVSRAAALVEVENCDLVLIVWDLKPLWEKPSAKKCVDEAALLGQQIAKLPAKTRSRIRLLCLTWELETWLLAEDRAVRDYLSTAAHPCNFKAPGKLDKVTDPKAELNKAFVAHRGKSRRYVDWQEAIQLVSRWPDAGKVGKVESFHRFSRMLTGAAKAAAPAFHQCGDVCNDLAHQAAQMGKN